MKPNPATIGPKFKQDASRIIDWIKQHQKELIEKLQENRELKWRSIPELSINLDEKLLDYIIVETKPQIKGNEIVHREPFYLILEN